MNDVNGRTLIGAVVTWLFPLVVSFALYDPQTGAYYPSYTGFKIIMALLAALTCFATYRWIRARRPLTAGTAATYVAANSVLDLVLLVAVFGVPFLVWAATIFPVYVIVFFGLYFLMSR